MRELVGGCVTPYLGLVPPCAVQGRCEATYASLHPLRMAEEKIDASEAITADVFSTVRNLSCQLVGASYHHYSNTHHSPISKTSHAELGNDTK